jgi:hypothetical protein
MRAQLLESGAKARWAVLSHVPPFVGWPNPFCLAQQGHSSHLGDAIAK